MYTTHIAELLQPFLEDGASGMLSPSQLNQISIYIDLLLRWNSRINLTSVRQPEDIVTRHFGESLFVARHLFPAAGQLGTSVLTGPAGPSPAQPYLIDVGSGAGFPGLPIKVWAPHIQLTLIESNQKKATFLREAVRALTLTSVDVFAGRAADFPAKGSVVTLRAVERFDSVLPLAASLLADRGRLAILVGEAQINRLRELVQDVKWAEPLALPLSANRVLILGSKESS
jgi:16S rRNA (guanine527-N7)-methyltransferase